MNGKCDLQNVTSFENTYKCIKIDGIAEGQSLSMQTDKTKQK